MALNFSVKQETKDAANISTDQLIAVLINKTAAEIEAHISAQFSAIANMTDAQIDTYVDNNINDLPDVKQALKLLVKDMKTTNNILMTLTKITVFLAKKELSL